MSPTVRHDSSGVLDVVRGHGTPLRVRAYAAATLAGALALITVLALRGAAFPPPVALCLLAIPLALCMNRFVFFPNEVGVTADAAVIFAAVVGFREDAVWLGPMLVALLVGPLDVTHWHERAFVRMVYNSGSSAIVTLAGAAAFVALSQMWGTGWLAVLGAASAGAVVYMLTESVFGVVLVSLQGEPTLTAIRHQLPVNTVALPLALYGTAAGLLVGPAGWVPVVLLLLPVPLMPELMLVEIPRRWRGPHRSTGLRVVGAVALLGGLAMVFPFPPPVALAWLAIVATVIGIEGRVTAWDPVPALTAVGVAAAVVVVRGDARFAAAVAVAAGATGCAWALVRQPLPGRGLPVGALGALVGAGAYTVVDPTSAVSTGSLVAAIVAGLACLVITDRRPSTAVWCLPMIAASGALALLWREVGILGGSTFGIGMLAVLVAAAAWGAPPWRSRVLGRWAARRLQRWRRAALVGAAGVALIAAGIATATNDETRTAWLLLGLAFTESGLAMALVGVRQWRFTPRRRRTEAMLLDVTALGVCLSIPAAELPRWSGLVVTTAAVALAIWIAWPLAPGVDHRVAAAREPGDGSG